MDNMRILEGWTDEERKELEEAKDNGFLSAITLIRGISNGDCHCHELSKKYCRDDTNGNNQMARDVADYYAGVAKFPEQKYYVHFLKSDGGSYLNIDTDGEVELDNRFEFNGWKTKFTRDEVVAIDSRFLPFMEKVED